MIYRDAFAVMRGHSFFLFTFDDETENKKFFILLLHEKSEKQEKFCRIFVIVFVQKYIFTLQI